MKYGWNIILAFGFLPVFKCVLKFVMWVPVGRLIAFNVTLYQKLCNEISWFLKFKQLKFDQAVITGDRKWLSFFVYQLKSFYWKSSFCVNSPACTWKERLWWKPTASAAIWRWLIQIDTNRAREDSPPSRDNFRCLFSWIPYTLPIFLFSFLYFFKVSPEDLWYPTSGLFRESYTGHE